MNRSIKKNISEHVVFIALISLMKSALASELPGEGPRLQERDRVTQEQIVSGEKSLLEIRTAGLLIFTTPFNKYDGYGDGPHDPNIADQRMPTSGNRPTLQGNGSFLRVNGLDAQTCLECHAIVSNRTIPATLGVGGVGGINTSAMFLPDNMNVTDTDFDGSADFNGRLINPPFLFGVGGVELLAREMTQDLQDLKRLALQNPGTVISLESKQVQFGSISASSVGTLDTSQVQGVDDDLVVRPFGRKGDVTSVREFAVNALAFHMGMQSVEVFGGPFADADNDGVANEMSLGDLSALNIFLSTLERPQQKNPRKHKVGAALFKQVGCATCHVPVLSTRQTRLPLTLTDMPEEPFANAFYDLDLTDAPTRFERNSGGGVEVRLFSDLKRHDMGRDLAESFDLASSRQNHEFLTAKLWGLADSAPYMHDGRAFTLQEAIRMHDNPGSEATSSARMFMNLNHSEKKKLLEYLLSLRTPERPSEDLLQSGRGGNAAVN